MAVETLALVATTIGTPFGDMVAIASDHGLCLLEFTTRENLASETREIEERFGCRITPGDHPIFQTLETQLAAYFRSESAVFTIPLVLPGTPFQQSVWRALLEIPSGETRSYAQQAASMGRPDAVRAVARANGQNRIAILVPCHRVIGSGGDLTGYAGGIDRKRWLLEHERAMAGEDLFAASA